MNKISWDEYNNALQAANSTELGKISSIIIELDKIAAKVEKENPVIALAVDRVSDKLELYVEAGLATDIFNKLKGYAEKVPGLKEVTKLMSGKKPTDIMADIIKKIGMPNQRDIEEAQKLRDSLFSKKASEIHTAGIFDAFRNIKKTVMTMVLLSLLSGVAGKAFAGSQKDMIKQFEAFKEKNNTEFANFVEGAGAEFASFIGDAGIEDAGVEVGEEPPEKKTSPQMEEDEGDKNVASEEESETAFQKFYGEAMKVAGEFKNTANEEISVKGVITINGVPFNIENKQQKLVMNGINDLMFMQLDLFIYDDPLVEKILRLLMSKAMEKWPNM